MSTLPDNFDEFSQLKILFFGGNQFERIPSCLGRMKSLFMLSFKSNKLIEISEDSLTPSIGWLILTDNQLSNLPHSIGNLQGLRKLMLANNQLKSLPPELATCKQLELVRLSCNCLEHIPDFIFDLPNLSWLAISGNPCVGSVVTSSATTTTDSSINKLSYKLSDLAIGEKIGSGASGDVFSVHVHCRGGGGGDSASQHENEPDTNAYALKLFRGICGSDGNPRDEMEISRYIGNHSCILSPIAFIEDVNGDIDEPVLGIVFPKLDPKKCTSLGQPPSFDTVTRDVYLPDTSFSCHFVLHVVQGVCAACAHLHHRGIMHGDLYAHNILVHYDGTPMLVDFGAASKYDGLTRIQSSNMQRIEVRAFGCLVEELLRYVKLCDQPENIGADPFHVYHQEVKVLHSLQSISASCLHPTPSRRPTFESICLSLLAISN